MCSFSFVHLTCSRCLRNSHMHQSLANFRSQIKSVFFLFCPSFLAYGLFKSHPMCWKIGSIAKKWCNCVSEVKLIALMSILCRLYVPLKHSFAVLRTVKAISQRIDGERKNKQKNRVQCEINIVSGRHLSAMYVYDLVFHFVLCVFSLMLMAKYRYHSARIGCRMRVHADILCYRIDDCSRINGTL